MDFYIEEKQRQDLCAKYGRGQEKRELYSGCFLLILFRAGGVVKAVHALWEFDKSVLRFINLYEH